MWNLRTLAQFQGSEMWTQGQSKANFFGFCLVQIKINKRQVESKIPLCNPSDGKLLLRSSASYNKLLDRVAFRILSNIHDGALLQK